MKRIMELEQKLGTAKEVLSSAKDAADYFTAIKAGEERKTALVEVEEYRSKESKLADAVEKIVTQTDEAEALLKDAEKRKHDLETGGWTFFRKTKIDRTQKAMDELSSAIESYTSKKTETEGELESTRTKIADVEAKIAIEIPTYEVSLELCDYIVGEEFDEDKFVQAHELYKSATESLELVRLADKVKVCAKYDLDETARMLADDVTESEKVKAKISELEAKIKAYHASKTCSDAQGCLETLKLIDEAEAELVEEKEEDRYAEKRVTSSQKRLERRTTDKKDALVIMPQLEQLGDLLSADYSLLIEKIEEKLVADAKMLVAKYAIPVSDVTYAGKLASEGFKIALVRYDAMARIHHWCDSCKAWEGDQYGSYLQKGEYDERMIKIFDLPEEKQKESIDRFAERCHLGQGSYGTVQIGWRREVKIGLAIKSDSADALLDVLAKKCLFRIDKPDKRPGRRSYQRKVDSRTVLKKLLVDEEAIEKLTHTYY